MSEDSKFVGRNALYSGVELSSSVLVQKDEVHMMSPDSVKSSKATIFIQKLQLSLVYHLTLSKSVKYDPSWSSWDVIEGSILNKNVMIPSVTPWIFHKSHFLS